MTIYEQFLQMGHNVPQVNDFRELVYNSASRFSTKNAFVPRDRNVSYYEFCLEYKYLTTYFLANGYRNKKIAIVGSNSYGWILSYLAASTVGVSVPIDKELTSDDILSFAKAAECFAIVGDLGIIENIEYECEKTKT